MIRLLHLADLHLGWQPRFITDPAAALRYSEARHSVFDAAVGAALEPGNRVDAVLIAGDLFDDHRPDTALVERVIAGLSTLVTYGILVVTVPGNHDELTYADSVYRTQAARWPGTLVRSASMGQAVTVRCRDEDLHVYSMAYTGGVTEISRPLAVFPRADLPGIHVATLHGTVVKAPQGSPGWAFQERSLPIAAEALTEVGYDYAALGHLHRPGAAAGQTDRAAYAGLVAGRGFDDPGCGYLTLVSLQDAPALPTVSRLPVSLPALARFTVPLAGTGTVEAIVTAAGSQLARVGAGSLVELCLIGPVAEPVDVDAVSAAVAARAGLLHVSVRDGTSLMGADQVRQWESESTLRGFFIRRMMQAGQASGAGAAPSEEESRIAERALRHGLTALERAGR